MFPTFYSLCNKYPDTDKDGDLPQGLHSYAVPYEQLLSSRRLDVKRVLEVGVRHGGSLKLWRDYFPNALVFGADNGSEAGLWKSDCDRIHVEYADSTKPQTLAALGATFGPFDLIVDDGSHYYIHQIATFAALRPYLAPGGIYVVEDVSDISYAEIMAKEFGGKVYDLKAVKNRHDDHLVVFHG